MKKIETTLDAVRELLKRIHDEADHGLYTEVEKPVKVLRQNMQIIRALAKTALKYLG